MSVVATGFFDGVHLGHRLVIDTLVSEAHRLGDESVVVTFWPHPRTVLQNGARELRLLSSLSEKKELLHSLGVDRVEVLDFTRDFSRLTAEQYLRDVLVCHFGANAIVLGYDNRLGADGLRRDEIIPLAESLGLRVILTPALSSHLLSAASADSPLAPAADCSFATAAAASSPAAVDPDCAAGYPVVVSSTKIREALQKGRVEDAAEMLGRRYSLHGVVVAGNRMGRELGFPTANIRLYDPLKLIPANGVYLVEVVAQGSSCHGMLNIGVRPTVSSANERTLEVHIFDFDEQIYGLDIRVSFISRIRDEIRFGSLRELKEQLQNDERLCRKRLNPAEAD